MPMMWIDDVEALTFKNYVVFVVFPSCTLLPQKYGHKGQYVAIAIGTQSSQRTCIKEIQNVQTVMVVTQSET